MAIRIKHPKYELKRKIDALHLRWKLMKFDTENEKQAKNNVCKRLDEMYLRYKKM
jgi:hypothetical protein